MRAETAINVTGGLDELASVMGSAASSFSMLHNGKVAVVLAPHVAQTLSEKGWSKDDVKQYLYQQGMAPAQEWVKESVKKGAIPGVRDPQDITIFIAGGDLPIPQNIYFPLRGFPPCRITKEIKPYRKPMELSWKAEI